MRNYFKKSIRFIQFTSTLMVNQEKLTEIYLEGILFICYFVIQSTFKN